MNFTEAYKLMMGGKKIKRPCFKGYWFSDPETGNIMIHLENGREISYGNLNITIKNCAASDWEVVQD